MRWGLLTAVGAAALPWVYPSTFLLNVGPQILIMGIFAMSLNLLIGYTGMVSFGHAAYFGVGAYTLGILLQKTAVGLAAALVLAMAVAAGAALVIGFFCVRLGTIYFSMLTLAFAQIVYTIVIRWTALTGGDQGLIGGVRVPPIEVGSLTLTVRSPLTFYYLTLLAATAAFAAAKVLVDSPWGLLLRAVRDNAHRVGFLGASERGLRLAVFVVAGGFAGLAGALMTLYVGGAYPDFVYWTKSAEPIFMVLVGGMNTLLGPLVGAAILVSLTAVITQYTNLWGLVLGAILIAFTLFLKVGIFDFAVERLRRRPAGAEATEAGGVARAGSAR
ncbi:MAG: branched-chain amino acid ABC transporter permease [Candidatus Rokubacteria bacterium]|nr:branched-chain amino acid ABC transporter permease [Candidatus Rokubacteria bacterium]